MNTYTCICYSRASLCALTPPPPDVNIRQLMKLQNLLSVICRSHVSPRLHLAHFVRLTLVIVHFLAGVCFRQLRLCRSSVEYRTCLRIDMHKLQLQELNANINVCETSVFDLWLNSWFINTRLVRKDAVKFSIYSKKFLLTPTFHLSSVILLILSVHPC